MRLDPMLDSFYVLSVLGGGLPTSPVCTTGPGAMSRSTFAAIPAPPLGAPSRGPVAVTAFVNVNVVPMDTERVLANHTVLVEGGRITALGPVNKVQVPAGAVRIDGQSKYLMPGLSDMHVHNDIGSVDYEALAPRLMIFLAQGVTAIRYLNHISGDPQVFESAGVLSPRVYVRGFYTPRQGVEVESDQYPERKFNRPDSMAAYVAAAKAAGYDFIRIYASSLTNGNTRSAALDSLLAAARRLGVPVISHQHFVSLPALRALGAYGGTSDDHVRSLLEVLYRQPGGGGRRRDADVNLSEIPELAGAMRRAGVWITPTLACRIQKYDPSPAELKITQQLVKALQDSGGRALLSGDDGRSVHHELAAMVQGGLTPFQALRTGTYNAAASMGQLDEIGTVTVGKRADLVLLSGNPLADIRHASEPAGVVIGGRWLDRAELDQRVLALPLSKPWPKFWLRVEGGIYEQEAVYRPELRARGTALGRVLAPGGVDASKEQGLMLEIPLKKFAALTDSLTAAASNKDASQRVRQQMAEALGAMRAVLTPEQRETFDLIVRMWLREQARQGHAVKVPGIA